MVALWLAGQSLAPGQRRTDSFRRWVETHEDALFLPAASIVEIKAAIKSIPTSRAIRADALDKRLDGLVATFSDVIHPVDVNVATRTGEIMRSCRLTAPPRRAALHATGRRRVPADSSGCNSWLHYLLAQ